MRCPILRVVLSSVVVVVVVVVAHIVRAPFSGDRSGDKCRASLRGGVDQVRSEGAPLLRSPNEPGLSRNSWPKPAVFAVAFGMRRSPGLSCPPAGPPRMPSGSRIGITPHDRHDRPDRPGP